MTANHSSSSSHFRSAARQVVSLSGALRAADPQADWSRDVRVVDLGMGGACIEASDSLGQGTAVELVLDTPHLWDPLSLSGVVAWTREVPKSEGGGALLGVRFEHATGSTVRTLTELLEAEAFG